MSPAVAINHESMLGGPKVWPCCHVDTHLTHQGSPTFLMSGGISSTDVHFQSTGSPRTWNNAEPRTNECLIVHGFRLFINCFSRGYLLSSVALR